MEIPKFKTKDELFKFLITNKDDLIYEKKSTIKYADGFGAPIVLINKIDKTTSNKANEVNLDPVTQIEAKLIINTTMIKDSHGDVHINGIWNKSIKENKRIKHIQEHDMSFKSIISSQEDLKVSTKTYQWKELGYNADGETEALVFDSTIKQSRNPYMFEQYSKGYVDNHSVGMQYVKLELAIDSTDEDYKQEKANFDKYIDQIVNKEDVMNDSWFWAITEAKVVEGSAVPNGSNPITPTLSTSKETNIDEVQVKEVSKETQAYIDWLKK